MGDERLRSLGVLACVTSKLVGNRFKIQQNYSDGPLSDAQLDRVLTQHSEAHLGTLAIPVAPHPTLPYLH